MPSLKSRMAAFNKAATQETTPKKKPIVIPSSSSSSNGGGTTSTPKKLDLGRLNQLNNLVTPEKNKTPVKKKPIDLRATNSSQQPGSSEKEKEQANKVVPMSIKNQNWDHLYELALQFDQLKLQEAEDAKNPPKRAISPPKKHDQGDKKGIKGALEGLVGGNFTANGNFLDNDYISKHLIENKKFKNLAFDYSGQSKLFKRFDRKDSERRNICTMFVDAILNHPKSKDITSLQMANCLLPDEFPEILAELCIAKKGLPKLQVINMESNLLQKDGIIGLSKAIADPNIWRNLQFLKLENQKAQMASDAEDILGDAVIQSTSIVAVSLRVRGGLARQQINNTVAANVDNLRQARRKHTEKTGGTISRKRNEMEQYFDKIASNDSSITDVDLVGNIKFLGLNATERTKSGTAFSTNFHVKTIKLVKLKLDDDFAQAFGKALAQNSTIEKVVVDSNAFSGTGIKYLLEGVGHNTSIVEFQVRHQSKTTSSSDEQALPPLLAPNKTITKLGVDLRDQMAKMGIDRKLNENREHQRKLRAAAKKG
jgi:hypothetical protein